MANSLYYINSTSGPSKRELLVDHMRRKLQKVADMSEPAQRAFLAVLRQDLAREPEQDQRILNLLMRGADRRLWGRRGEMSSTERAVYTAMTLYALHQQGHDFQEERMHQDGVTFGAAIRQYAFTLVDADGEDARNRMLTRLKNVLMASRIEDAAYHLRGIIQLLRSESVPLDYVSFAADLYDLQYDDAKARVAARWLYDLYGKRKAAEDSTETPVETIPEKKDGRSGRQKLMTYMEEKLQILLTGADPAGQAAVLAQLRHGLGKKVGEDIDATAVLIRDAEDGLFGENGYPKYAGTAAYQALTLFALHQQGHDAETAPMHKPGKRLGLSVLDLAGTSPDASAERERLRERLYLVSSAVSAEDAAVRLRAVITMLRDKGIPVDYVSLACDLYDFEVGEKTRATLRWANDLYSQAASAPKAEEGGAQTK